MQKGSRVNGIHSSGNSNPAATRDGHDLSISPFFFCIAPILSLYASNMGEIEITQIFRSLVVSLLATGSVLILLRVVIKDWMRSSLIVSVGLILFFTYGQIYKGLSLELAGELIARHRYLLPLTFLIFIGWSFWVLRWKVALVRSTNFFNIVGGILLLIPLSSIAVGKIGHKAPEKPVAEVISTGTFNKSDGARPDIYFLVLDGYGRGDVLRDLYDFDNAAFLRFLESEGFYIVTEGRSNYMQTLLSLGSSLNMDYLTEFEGWESRTRNDLDVFRGMIRHSLVRDVLQDAGYKLVAFETGYAPTTIYDADVYLDVADFLKLQKEFILALNDFEYLLLNSTLAVGIRDLRVKMGVLEDIKVEDPFSRHRERVRFILSKLGEVPSWDGDYLVFAHIISPHPPFVFSEDGSPINPKGAFTLADASNFEGSQDEYIQGYRGQLIYLNSLLEAAIKRILATSDQDPIIILQGDHGPGAYLDTNSMINSNLRERFSILNAIHMPEEWNGLLYDSITPVNTFRLISTEYFGVSLPLLEDKSYFATWRRPFDFIDVSERLDQ